MAGPGPDAAGRSPESYDRFVDISPDGDRIVRPDARLGSYTLDGDFMPAGFEYTIDGDLRSARWSFSPDGDPVRRPALEGCRTPEDEVALVRDLQQRKLDWL